MEGDGLPDEIRGELAALLADEATFTASYPLVADYLRTSPALQGTGDDAADQAFDLRLLYHMTLGRSDNPYWAIVGPSVTHAPAERGERREVNGGNPGGSGRLAYAQTVLQAAYAYAIPSPETVRWVVDACGGRPVVEIGAGRGYWAHQLDLAGVRVSAHDLHEPGEGNPWFGPTGAQPRTWHDVQPVADLDRAMSRDHVLMLCWPPAWEDPMASRTLAAYERTEGDRLIYVGEHRGGKSGDDAFFDALAERWDLVSVDPTYVSWWNQADVAECWTRR